MSDDDDAWLHRLARPSALWSGRLVYPFKQLQRLSPKMRQIVIAALEDEAARLQETRQVTATTFTITDLARGTVLGHAVICVDARYASVAWRGADRLDRRFSSPATWRSLSVELGPGLEAGPLPADCAVIQTLIEHGRRRSVVVQYVAAVPVEGTPDEVVARLDALARAGAAPAEVR